MRAPHHRLFTCVLALTVGGLTGHSAAPSSPQGMITAKAFTGIGGTTIATLTAHPRFPNSPDVVNYPAYFEWNASGEISAAPGNWGDNYGTQIVGYFHPPATGDYIFFIASDDNGVLYLSTDATAANKKLIAQESAYSNARQYLASAGNSTLTSKDSSQFTATEWPEKDLALGGAKITLQAGQAYYIEALAKEGGGGDHLSVAVQDPGFLIDASAPIPGNYLSSDRGNGPLTMVTQPQSQSVPERGPVTFRVTADGTPPHQFQWRRNGEDIADATQATYTITGVSMADHNAKFSVVVSGAQGEATSAEAVLTVIPDTVLPQLLGAKGNANLTEVVLRFSESLESISAGTLGNYSITRTGGSLAVTAAALSPDGTAVTLTTGQQTLGTKYTVRVNNLRDTAATPNTVAADSKAVFFPMGRLAEKNGFLVFEAENYDRNLDGLWIPDSTRGTPSGGVSMVNPNGAGGSEGATKLEYEMEFKQAATYVVWFRASGNDGNDDSAWLHLNGERPFERASGNQASMTGFQPQSDFVWRSDSQDGPDPFTVDIGVPGLHTIGLARREDGSFFDKFILTTDTTFTPTGFGPPETRDGVPSAPTVALTTPTTDQRFASGSSITLTATATGDMGLEIVRVDFTANGKAVGTATSSPFTVNWNDVPDGIYALQARATDELGVFALSASVVIEVGTPPPQVLLVIGTASIPVLNASDAGLKARLESRGWQVTVSEAPSSSAAQGDGKQLIIVSSTVASGDVAAKFRNALAPVILWEQAVQDDFLLTGNTDGTDRGTLAGQTQLNIVKADHPLAGGLPAGMKTVQTSSQDLSWGAPNTNAVIIATVVDNASRALIYGYEKGAVLADNTTAAPARRVMFFWADNGFAASTEDALKLFDAAVDWASGIKPAKPSSARIAWVSFHPGDESPSAAAATAGFTRAPDVAYTDLLKANGHQVTRVVTSGTPDVALLNAFDLVVISRSVPSGDYQDPPETAAWHSITAPTMILGGYVIRANRLGLTTGNTIPDTAGPVKLKVNNPAHPIFAGVQLESSQMMVNNYGDLVTYNGTVQRGISVNSDPIAGDGVVLATIGTDTDPAVGGMMIGEWQAGATLANASANVLGGHRLLFLTGSREQGITSEAAGLYDLTSDGAKMFLNAVHYMAGTEPAPVRPTIELTRSASGITITFTGILEAAANINGPWEVVPNAISPLAVTPSGAQRFYRTQL